MLKFSTCLRNAVAMSALALFLVSSSFAQEATMERFDIEAFNHHKSGFTWIYTLPDGTKIEQRYSPGTGYIVDKTPLHSGLTYRKGFNEQGNLIAVGQLFYSFPVGISKEYDSEGKLFRERNFDEGFAFSVEDLAAKMLADYKIDIMNADNVYRLARGIYSTDPLVSYYLVDCYDHTSPAPDQAVIAFLVNGTTGEVLHILHTNTRRPTPVLGAYLERIANTPKEGQ